MSRQVAVAADRATTTPANEQYATPAVGVGINAALRMDRGFMKLVPKETDFDPLRDDPDFLHLLELTAK